MSRTENLLGFQYRSPGWSVIEPTEGGVVIRDPDVTLARAITMGWRLLLPIALNLLLVWVLMSVFPVGLFLWVSEGIVGLLTVFGFYCIWQRWRTPSLVRIGGGRMFVRSQRGSKTIEHEWDVRQIVEIETAFGSSTFHSFYSFRVHLSDGSKLPFLHCMNSTEGYWVLNYLKMLISNEQGALLVQEGLAPAMAVSLPPPPLPAMANRVAAMEAQVVRTAPPGRPDSQSASISNQNRA